MMQFINARAFSRTIYGDRYKPNEIFSTGLAVNQSDVGVGLPQYAADDEAIENTDLVAWPMIGFTRADGEDWPVMPSKWMRSR